MSQGCNNGGDGVSEVLDAYERGSHVPQRIAGIPVLTADFLHLLH